MEASYISLAASAILGIIAYLLLLDRNRLASDISELQREVRRRHEDTHAGIERELGQLQEAIRRCERRDEQNRTREEASPGRR